MRIFLGFDDTDDHDSAMGTGRLVREFGYKLPEGYTLAGIVRHQLPRLDAIPFTSNNSSACAIIDMQDGGSPDQLRDLAVRHLETHCAPGSDPGLCLAPETEVTGSLIEFGQRATGRILTQKEAMHTARSVQLYGLGGTNDGIIGALAGVGLTRFGWCGRFIEFGRLRDLPGDMRVLDLNDIGVAVVSVDRDPLVPLPGDRVTDAGWIRPSLWDGRPVLQVRNVEHGVWAPAHAKRGKRKDNTQPGKPAVTASGRRQ